MQHFQTSLKAEWPKCRSDFKSITVIFVYKPFSLGYLLEKQNQTTGQYYFQAKFIHP